MSVEKPRDLSVGQLTRLVKGLLETQISYVWVGGEISNWRVSPAGHAYFTLKDKDSQIDAVMFRGKLMKLPFGPEGGLEVVAFGLVTVYEKTRQLPACLRGDAPEGCCRRTATHR